MIYEYALEPSLLSNWKDFRYFAEKFGVTKGRLISRFPKRWERMVLDSLAGCGEVEKARIVESLVSLKKCVLSRHHEWNDQHNWLLNAEIEHGKRPFQAVVAACNPRNRDFVLEADSVSDNNPIWSLPNLPPVCRTATVMAQRVAPLLCFSKRILFVDPHFRPDKIKWRRPLQAFLAVATNTRRPGDILKIEIHVNDELEPNYFATQCRQCLPEIIPNGIRVRVVQWREKQQGEKLHNRFILTDIGGVLFGVGLDDADGDDGQTDDIQLLNDETYTMRLAQYTDVTTVFDLVTEIIIDGKGRT